MIRRKLKRYTSVFCSTVKSKFFSSSCYFQVGNKDPIFLAKALTVSANSGCPGFGIQIHGCIFKLGYLNDVYSQNNLINMYYKCGGLRDGYKVFDEMFERNLVSWTLVISGFIQNGEFEVGLEVFLNMMRNGFMPNEFAFGSVMKVCVVSDLCDKLGFCIHGFVSKIGMENNPFVGTSLLNMYARMVDYEAMHWVFASMNDRDLGSWNAMIGGYAQHGNGVEAMKILSLMQRENMMMDEFTFVNAIKGCSSAGHLNFIKLIHGLIVQRGQCSTNVTNALVGTYYKNGGKDYGLKLFNRMQYKDVISWNILFGSFSIDRLAAGEIANFFRKFMLTGLKPNCVTFTTLFRLCGELVNLCFGGQLCCLALHFGFFDESNVVTSLINMFAKCGDTKSALLVFNSAPSKNIITWNEMIGACTLNGLNTEAVKFFCDLRVSGVEGNEYTFSSVLEACSHRENKELLYRQIHAVVLQSGFVSNCYVYSSLFKAYVGVALLDDCFELLNEFEHKLDLPSWATMISSFVNQSYDIEAMKLLSFMIRFGEKPDEFILGSILNSCAKTTAYYQTKCVHSLVTKTGFEAQVFVNTALLDAYAKSGDIASAQLAFNESVCFSDLILFNAMITAYAHHGLVKEAMEIFQKVKLANLKPSQSTFVSILLACSHLSLVNEGHKIFESMKLVYEIEPSSDCYGCLVDMYSRNGFIEEAKNVIEMMPFSPWPAILRTLLSGCTTHGNREVGEWAATKLLQLVPQNDVPYLLLSKIYVEGGSTEEAAIARKGIKMGPVKQDTACSWIETYLIQNINEPQGEILHDLMLSVSYKRFNMPHLITRSRYSFSFVPAKEYLLMLEDRFDSCGKPDS